jgi:hypothetical protein
MNRQKWILFVVALGAMAGAAGLLATFRDHPRLGQPGIKAEPIPGSLVMKIDLPDHVLEFTSTNVPEPKNVVDFLPPDTSFAGRIYTAPDGFWVQSTIVLMGADRTSIHKPEYCLPGNGWSIGTKSVANIPVAGPTSYQLPVAKWVLGQTLQAPDGRKQQVSGLYVFWLVADGEQTPDNNQRMWWLARDLVRTGVMQRWAYVSYFAVCEPGQEDAAFARMEKLIAASVPDFQIPPRGR